MLSKNIVFTEKNVARLIEEEVRMPESNEVLVKIMYSSISSGTERANLTGSKTVSWAAPEEKEAVFPRRAGYSTAGIVEKTGSGVKNFKPGDRVALSWTTHNQYVTMSEDLLIHIDDIPFEEGALFHIATFPLAAIRKCRFEIGESAIVMGMGILGLFAVKLLRASGAVPIIAVDPDEAKRKKALEIGADYALDPYAPDFKQKAKELTGKGAKVGIEVTGLGAGLDGILDCMALKGRVALLGCTRNSDFTIDYYRKVHGPGITLVGAHTMARPMFDSSDGWWTQRDDMLALKKLVEAKRLSFKDIVDETHSPEEAFEVYTRLATEKTFPIVQFDWSLIQ